MKKHIIALAALGLPLAAMAQTVKVDFEDASGYKSVGVYDTWEESPFRLGTLKGNCAVVDNFISPTNELGEVVNDSKKILGVQRSRFGSNTFGARIDLNTPFDITPDYKYVHVKIYKPVKGRVMLVALGKRPDRAGQSNDVEQAWAYSTSVSVANQWFDAVFPIKGCNGVQVHSLVVVPDASSPQELTSDFAAYIDDIEVNDSPDPRFTPGAIYGLNFEESATSGKPERYIASVKLNSPSAGNQTIEVGSVSPQLIYRDFTEKVFNAKAGETLTPSIDYKNGGWMNGYVYVDQNNNGKFEATFDNNTHKVAEGADLMSYYYYETVEDKSGYKYDGTAVSGNDRNNLSTPAFTLPAGMTPGFYRMRYKVDWGNIDPAGRMTSTNSIQQNGGYIVDVRLNVHADQVNLSAGSRNGYITLSDGTELVNYKTAFGKSVKLKATPAPGFVIDSLVISHGYNLEGDQYNAYGNKQYDKLVVRAADFAADGTYTLDARYVDGDISIDGQFASATATAVKGAANERALTFSTAAGTLTFNAAKAAKVTVVDANGRILFSSKVKGTRTIALPKGVYVVNDTKVVVP